MTKVYQVFIGCPFLTRIRQNYDRLKHELESDTPLHIVLADTAAISSTDYLLEHITNLIRESGSCIFDVTGGNPNVSLEVGIAHALPADFLLVLNPRKPRAQSTAQRALEHEGETRQMISDLQGRNRVEYETYETMKTRILSRYLAGIPYMRRWKDFKRRHSSYAAPALEIFDDIRTSERILCPRVTAILDGTGIATNDILTALSTAKLLTIRRGRAGGIYYPPK